MSTLIFIPIPLIEESPNSMLSRLAANHGYEDKLKALAALTGKPTFRKLQISNQSDFAKLIIPNSGKHSAKIESCFYQRSNERRLHPSLIIHGLTVPKKLIRFDKAAYCSGCRKEGWERYISDIKLADFCPYHKCKYLFQCPRCGLNLSWISALHSKCRCSFEFHSEPYYGTDRLPEEDLLEIFRRGDQIALNQIISILNNIGYDSTRKANTAQNRELFKLTINIVGGDCSRIIEHLKELESRHPATEKKLLCATLATLNHPVVNDAINEFSSISSTPIIQGNPPSNDIYLTKPQLMSAYGISARQWLKIIKSPSFNCTKSGRRKLFSREQSTEILSIYEQLKSFDLDSTRITIKEAAAKSNIPIRSIGKLLNDDIFPSSKGRHGETLLSLKATESLAHDFSTIEDVSKKLNCSKPVTLMLIERISSEAPHINHYANHFRIVPNQIISKLSDELSATIDKLKRLQKSHYNSTRPLPNSLRTQYMSASDASEILRINSRVICQFAKAGVFGEIYHVMGSGFRISKQAINSFHADYILTSELVSKTGIPRNTLAYVLRRLGVYQVTGSLVDGGGTPLYSRQSIAALPNMAIISKSEDKSTYQHSSNSIALDNHVELNRILLRFNITRKNFHQTFITTGMVSPVTSDSRAYLRKEEEKIISKILTKYYTAAQADRIFGYNGFTRKLIRSHRITPDRATSKLPCYVLMFRKEKIDAYLEELNMKAKTFSAS